MSRRNEDQTLPIAELLGIEPAILTTAEQNVGTPVVILTCVRCRTAVGARSASRSASPTPNGCVRTSQTCCSGCDRSPR